MFPEKQAYARLLEFDGQSEAFLVDDGEELRKSIVDVVDGVPGLVFIFVCPVEIVHVEGDAHLAEEVHRFEPDFEGVRG